MDANPATSPFTQILAGYWRMGAGDCAQTWSTAAMIRFRSSVNSVRSRAQSSSAEPADDSVDCPLPSVRTPPATVRRRRCRGRR